MGSSPVAPDVLGIASRFVRARLSAGTITEYPGAIPDDLATSYAIQDHAISLWPDQVVGWKVGKLSPEQATRYGANRLAGPIFSRQVWHAEPGETFAFPVFEGGFAAPEAEVVLVLGEDAPDGKTDWTHEEAAALVATAHIGVETAGSPLATINDLGPTVIVSDFGNNNGLLLGAEIDDWRAALEAGIECETVIDGAVAGTGTTEQLPEGPLESLRFLLELNAGRGRPLRGGDLVSSGAINGVHSISTGQLSRHSFGNHGRIECVAEAASGEDSGN